MSTPKTTTTPNLAASSPVHQAAIAAGNDHFRAWEYNVIDAYKDKTVDEIRKCLRDTAFPYAVCIEHVIGDLNFGTIVRNANAFNAREVFYLGDKRWDRRAALGVQNYTDVRWLPTIADFEKLSERYTIVGVDNIAGSIPLAEHEWQPDTLVVFGEEGVGITPKTQSMCSKIVCIPQFGSVRSINVGTASGIIMHDIASKFTGGKS